MSKKKSSKAPKVATPTPASEYTKDAAGNVISQRVYDPKLKAYTTQTFDTPAQRLNKALSQSLQNQSLSLISDPKAFDKYAKQNQENYYNASVAPVIQSANDATKQGIQSFGARGMLDSAGFANYLANQIQGNKQRALQSSAQNAVAYGQDAANQLYNRNLSNIQVGGAGQADYNNYINSLQNSVMQGANSTNQFNQNNAQINLQNAQNQMYQNQLNAQNRGGGFLSSISRLF